MIAVIFEVTPADGQIDEYLAIAARLREDLMTIEGFISIERFQSLTLPGKILSLSFWENEEAVQKWRKMEIHRQAQSKGRESVFSHYRLRVAGVMRDYGMNDREQAPEDSKIMNK